MLKNIEPSYESASTLPSGFMVLHGNRLEDLRDLLVHMLKAQPLAVLEPEVILLQSNGMKHWLERALCAEEALGICAATRMALPSAFLWQVYRAVLGAADVPAAMPFDKSSLVWRLVRLLPVLCEQNPVYAPLKRYLGEPLQPRKLYQLALQLADVLDGYQSYRADWLADWAAGRNLLAGSDQREIPTKQTWQAQLWRDLRADVGSALQDSSRAVVHERFLMAMTAVAQRHAATGQLPRGLPARLVVFGVSSLPMQLVQALAALGQVCQVLMLVQNPCQYFWGDLVEGHAALRAQVRRRQSAKPQSHQAQAAGEAAANSASKVWQAATHAAPAGHPLLASWGKQGRDYLHLLDGFDAPEQYRRHWSKVDVFVDPASTDPAQPASQLALLQSNILHLNPEPEAPQTMAWDESIEFVSAHSAQRELEVLHDRLLGWFDADPELTPSAVMVMVPDMAAFAPHIDAVFGQFEPGQAGYIPYAVADASARSTPLVQALEQLLNLPQTRLTLQDWSGLFEVAAVRKRFDLSEPDALVLQDWLSLAGVRWGLDGAHRHSWGLPAQTPGLAQNTWLFGLRRLLLGYALGAGQDVHPDGAGQPANDCTSALWQATLAQPALSGLSAAVMTSLLAWLQATTDTLQDLSLDHTPLEWGRILTQLVTRFFAPADDADERALARLVAPLQSWLDACEAASLVTPLPLEVVREHWLGNIDSDSLQQRFFGGGVQFGTLMPMRSIPFEVIALLGMNDGAYPRVQAARDFDLMASSWRAGDRSRREDDRYLFLEALLSARQKLYVSWQGRSATDNSPRPPSVLVAQLLDHVNALWQPAHTPQAQPLQPFSRVYFEAGSGFQTYASNWALAHMNQAQVATENKALEAGECPHHLTLEDLQRLLRAPVEVFFRNRLQTTLDQLTDLAEPDEPFALNALQQYQLGTELLRQADAAQALGQLQGSGQLPLAGFGERSARALQDVAEQVRARRTPWLMLYPQPLPAQLIDLTFNDDFGLSGVLDGLLHQPGTSAQHNALSVVEPSTAVPMACLQLCERPGALWQGKPGAEQVRGHVLTTLWVRHLAGCASGLQLTSVLVGVDGDVLLRPMPAPQAQALLKRLVQAYAQAWAEPLPVAVKTAWAFLQCLAANAQLPPDKSPKDPHEAARTTFETQPGGRFPGEWAQSAYLQRAFEGYADLADGLPHWAPLLYGDLSAWVGNEPAACRHDLLST
ncbi:exodeoxyribonuclease V subunit gamma [Rhodoferax sp.]|uniref:exodeoxyribonuclease V subunit gamma n=1 Tax=Rhodoferax sp. TaxID=50421 RepID=UPI0026109069|nr:exodeoxyribonuclease V subunit gamma [Rhodoferax sp.]MDD5479165.1 exodeoxyribonuclease V subunit gamma [Rhodoferax sp.]